MGLLGPGGRESVEPIATRVALEHVQQLHLMPLMNHPGCSMAMPPHDRFWPYGAPRGRVAVLPLV